MRTQRRVGEDEIVDNAEGRASRARPKSRGRSPVPAPTDNEGWISRNKNNVPEKSSSRTNSSRLKDQMKKQGMKLDDGDSSSKFAFISSAVLYGAFKGEEKAVPVIGDQFQEWFKNV